MTEPPGSGPDFPVLLVLPVLNAAAARLSRTLDGLARTAGKFGVAVSGGPDSVALLLLAAAARPDRVVAASVDHALREGSRAEANVVAEICRTLKIPHETLTAEWDEKPKVAIQERARAERYRLLAEWAKREGVDAILTAHHADDQAETLLMRLARGAGVRGLSAMRPVRRFRQIGLTVIRPLLGWRRSELADLCAAAGVIPVNDPSNDDPQFERVRIRRAITESDWINPAAVAKSAAHLAQADGALRWATKREWDQSVKSSAESFEYSPGDAPIEIRRRIARLAVLRLASEGGGKELRGGELDRLVTALSSGRKATLRGVLCSGGDSWRFARARARANARANANANVHVPRAEPSI